MFFDTVTHEEGDLLKVLGLWGTTQNVVGWRITKVRAGNRKGGYNSSPIVRLDYSEEQ